MIRKRIFQIFIWLCMCSVVIGEESISAETEHDADSQSDARTAMFRLNTMCGPNCIWQIAKAYGKDYPLKDIAKLAGTNATRGTTVKGLVEACKKIGLPAEAVKTNVKTLARNPRVAILLLKTNDLMHYVILDGINDNKVRLLDTTKFREMTIDELKSIWTGIAILVGTQENYQKDYFQRYLGASLQISGLLILLVAAAYGVKATHLYLSKHQ